MMYRDNLYYCLSGFALGVGAGAALMYLLDPESGNRRRALTKDQLAHAGNVTKESLQSTAADLRHRSKGLAHEIEDRLSPDEEIPAAKLEERVRESLGRNVQNPSLVTVSADRGRVTVTGQVQRQEVDEVLAAVESTPGVHAVDSQLDIRDDIEDLPGVQAAN